MISYNSLPSFNNPSPRDILIPDCVSTALYVSRRNKKLKGSLKVYILESTRQISFDVSQIRPTKEISQKEYE